MGLVDATIFYLDEKLLDRFVMIIGLFELIILTISALVIILLVLAIIYLLKR